MLLKTISTLWLLGLCFAVAGQQIEGAKGKEKFRFSSIQQVGFVAGANPPELQLQSIYGVKRSTLFAGIGAGLDYYYLRSVTVFADVHKELFNKKHPFYVYGVLGGNSIWLRERDKNPWTRSDYGLGLYADAGAGYKFILGKKAAILLNAGYSLKTFSEERSGGMFCIWGRCPENKEQLKYNLKRISLKAGFQF